MRCGIALLLIFNSVYSLPNCSEINTIKPCIYNGPKQKRIFPLKSLSPNSVERSAEITEENWNNVTRGHIHFLYRSQGPYGSLGTSQHNSHNCNSYHTHNSVNTDDSVNSVNSVDGTRLTPIREHPMKKCIPIPHLRHVQYVMSIGVGTPKQEIYPIIDTGSTNTWVISEQCNSITCSGVPTFNSRKSSTFSPVNEGLRIRFGTGTIKGVLGIDNVTIGQDTIEKQIFGLVNEESSNVFKVIKFQGIIGLGFPKLAFDHHTSLYDNYSKQINADLIFSLYFSNQYSYVMIGGVDERFYVGDLYMLPVVREYYWEIKLYELWVGNVKLCCDDESYVIFDSGTSFNTMPHDQFLYFKHIVSPKICHVLDDVLEYPVIRYVFDGGVELRLEPSEYIFLHKNKCRIAYMQIDVPSSYGRAYILGTQAFMTHFYTVYQRDPAMVRCGVWSNGTSYLLVIFPQS